MKKIPLTLKFLVAVLVGLVSIFALRAIAYEKFQQEKKSPIEVCITEPVTVKSTKQLEDWLNKDVGSKNYKVRIKDEKPIGNWKDCTTSERAATADAEPSATPQPSATPGGGAQVTQHLRLSEAELQEFANMLEATPTPTPTPSP